ncbi:hypothetical protein M3A49_28555 [Paraburkholderia sp. CNPSo 3076]|uniref:hypothetical protein n=1 Tax=Paraburkholderia sp. CNPSo 3076 TaxID=2940936 RepID=UPI0022548F70|nr:hypothetical protein [Paraburkholderia sp. CNPSo 3076]MCX5543393.1 hypothetical protein [Paraburkholderia sp. CNPSo 3076]
MPPMLYAFTTSFHLPPPDPLDDPQRAPLPPQPDDRPPPTLPEGDPPPHMSPERLERAARFA